MTKEKTFCETSQIYHGLVITADTNIVLILLVLALDEIESSWQFYLTEMDHNILSEAMTSDNYLWPSTIQTILAFVYVFTIYFYKYIQYRQYIHYKIRDMIK